MKGVFFTSKEIAGFLSLCGASLSFFKQTVSQGPLVLNTRKSKENRQKWLQNMLHDVSVE